MGINPALGSVLAVLWIIPTSREVMVSQEIPFSSPLLHHRAGAGREELQLKCTIQDSHGFFLL